MKSKKNCIFLTIFILLLSIIISLHEAKAEWKSITGTTTNNLYGIWGSSENNIFAVGGSGTILYYNGSEWTIMPAVTSANLSEIWGSDPNNIFAVGDSGTILHYDGTVWTGMASNSDAFLKGVGGTSEKDVFAVGYTADGYGVILHYDGNIWTTTENELLNYVWDIFGIAENNLYAVGFSYTSGAVYHYKGSLNELAVSFPPLYGVWGSAEDDIFVAGGGVLSLFIGHYDGTSWKTVKTGGSNQLMDVWGTASDNVYAVGNSGTILHYDGDTWSEEASGTANQLQGIWGSSPENIFAVGQSGTILHYEPAESPVLSVTPSFRDVSSGNGTTSFQIANSGTGTMVWTANSNSDWLNITSGNTGTNTGIITVSYEANTNETPRTGTITVTASGAEKSPQTVEIKQTALTFTPILSVTPAYRDISENVGTASFNVANTGTGTMTWNAKSNTSWLTITGGSSGTNTGVISINCAVNPGGTARTGLITVTAPDADKTPQSVEVRQAAHKFIPFLSVTPALLNLSSEDGTASFEIKNTGTGTMTWTATPDDADWYSVTPNSGTNNGVVTINYDANTGKSRTGKITVTSAEAANSPQIVEIKQSCGFELSVTQNLFEFSSNSGTISFEIANIGTGEMGWSISKNGDWFSADQNSGINHAVIQVTYQENTTDEARTGNITVTADDAKNSPQIIELKQERTDWMKMLSPVSANLRGVWGSSANNVFAVGSKGTILHYNGITWTKAESGTESYLRAIWGSSKDNIFAVGYEGIILHYGGINWSAMESGVSDNLTAIWGDSEKNIFVVGDNGVILRYTQNIGTRDAKQGKWIKMQGGTFNPLYGIWGDSKNNIFAVGGAWDSSSLLHYDGNINNTWTEIPITVASDTPYGIWGYSGNYIFAVGNTGIILNYNGGYWNGMTSGTSNYLRGVWGSSADNIFAVGVSGTILRYNGNIWAAMTMPVSNDLYAVWGSSENDIFAVGNSGTILHFPFQTTLPGDVDANHKVELYDAILALKLLTGINDGGIQIKADVNGDQKIGMEEVIYILQKISGLK